MAPPFTMDFPYPSQRMPVFARNCVATSQPLAAQAGLEIMRRGGNAIDAAVATAIALTVVEPTSNGIGADAFALIWAGGGLHGLNASGRSPSAFDIGAFAGHDAIPFYGWGGVTTPGAVSAWVEASSRFGALPFHQLCAPAIHYARHGFHVSPQTAYYWQRGNDRYPKDATFDPWRQTFAPNGRAPKAGDLFKSEGHARTLELIADTEGVAFYKGELADQIDAAARAARAPLSARDLHDHAPDWVRPIATDYHGLTLHEIPPNGQGLTALIALGILRHVDHDRSMPDSPLWHHVQIEAMKLAFRDAHRFIADPAFMDTTAEALLDDSYLASRAALIDPSKAQDFGHGTPKPSGTVYLTAADADGNMVSFIQSNYTGFGSGIVVPGTGIALQNRGCCFTLEAGHPNQAAPNKRPYHTIIPGFVTRKNSAGNDEPVMSFGVMGGYMQPQGHAQVIVRIADHKQNPQAALDAPRWQVTSGLGVTIEPGFDATFYDTLRDMGHDVTIAKARTVSHGRGQCIWKLEDGGYLAASDQRSDGQAVGY